MQLADTRVALIGAGLIGCAWSVVFARAGCSVSLYDASATQLDAAMREIDRMLGELASGGLLSRPAMEARQRIAVAHSLADAVARADHVQENVAEDAAIKRRVFEELDAAAPPEAVLASSTSGIPASAFTENLARRTRCLVAHPINPPHLVPLVELAGAPWTHPDAVARTRALMLAVGQAPIVVRRETEGFIVNRLQGALLREAFALYREGIASVADIDAAVRDGLSLRWTFMGPLETIDLNAPEGIADYCGRYGALYARIAPSKPAEPWDPDLIARIEAERRALLPRSALPARKRWRDANLVRVNSLRRVTLVGD